MLSLKQRPSFNFSFPEGLKAFGKPKQTEACDLIRLIWGRLPQSALRYVDWLMHSASTNAIITSIRFKFSHLDWQYHFSVGSSTTQRSEDLTHIRSRAPYHLTNIFHIYQLIGSR